MNQLSRLLEEVTSDVSYYMDYKGYGIKDFPIIKKSDVHSNYEKFINNKIDSELVMEKLRSKMQLKNYIIEKELDKIGILEWTTGSSGIPFKCFKTFEERNRMSIALWKNRRKMYRDMIPRKFYPLIHTGLKIPEYDVRDYSHENLTNMYEYIKANGYNCIHTTPTLLKRHFLESKVNLEFIKDSLKYIESTGSFLADEKKTKYEEITGALNEKLNSINPEVSLVCKINFFYLALTKP